MKHVTILVMLIFTHYGLAQWVKTPSPTISSINSIYFLNKQVGFITTDTKIYKTTDTGEKWLPTEIGPNYNLYNIVFVDSTLGFIAGSKNGKGIVLKTTNCGNTWISDSIGFANAFFDISFVNKNIGWIFGEIGSLVGKIGKTTDGGLTWLDQQVDSYGPILTGCFVDSLNGWAAGEKPSLIRSTNGGMTWFNIDTAYMRSDSVVPLRSIHFINNNIGWVVGGIAEYNAILKTTNGGVTWSHKIFKPNNSKPEYGVARLNDVFFINDRIGYVVGRDITPGGNYELILKSTNGGISWTKQDNQIANELNSVFIITDSVSWSSGFSGTLLKTINGGIASVNHNSNNIQYISLMQNYPNPFNSTTIIQFTIPRNQFVTLRVFDILGRQINTILNENITMGSHSVSFDPNKFNMCSGIYFYQLATEDFSKTKPMLFIK